MSASDSSAGHVTGSCLCGDVRFRIGLPTLWAAHCHCSMCRRAHGAAFVTWIGAAAERFELTSGGDCIGRYQSSSEAVRSFCTHCGSTLLFESSRWPGEVHVVYANLDAPADREPNAHVYWADHVSWGDLRGHELQCIDPG